MSVYDMRTMAARSSLPRQFEDIICEVERATKKFPTWPTDPIHALMVLGEEFGELTKAVLQKTYEPHKTDFSEIRKEAIQTAAMAVRFLMSLDQYQYHPCEQHKQMDDMGSQKEFVLTLNPSLVAAVKREYGKKEPQ